MADTRNPNVSMTIMLDADRKSLLLITPDGDHLHVGAGPNAGATIVDWLRIQERKQPIDEGANRTWHDADPTGRLANRRQTVEDFIASGGTVKVIKPVKRGFQPQTPEQRAASVRTKINAMSAAERATLLALLTAQENGESNDNAS